MSVIPRLRQNDPAIKSIRIRLRNEPLDVDLALALEQNTFVTDIDLDVGGVQQGDWNSLLRVIATRVKLTQVLLEDAMSAERRIRPAALISAILRAIQQNTSVRTVYLYYLHLPTDISTFVDIATSITVLWLWSCDMEHGEREHGIRDLVAALQRNTNVETLQLGELADIYTLPIVEGLRSNTSLKTFIFSPESFSDAVSHALQQLLESTTSIRRFELKRSTFSERVFCPIAQGIMNSGCVSELRFSRCGFRDRNTFAQLQSILQNKRNLTSLCLECCFFGGGQVHEDIITLLLRPDSQLRCFEFESCHTRPVEILERVFPRIPFEALLRAIEKSKLERFKIGTIRSQQQLQTLTQSIPSMKLEELEVVFIEAQEDEFDQETIKQVLFQAVKNNFSLRTVKGEIEFYHDSIDLFESAEDKQTLAFYANRNKSLDQWVDHPQTIKEQKVWPDALGLAERAGPSALFRGLRSVLERDYVSLPGRKESKRPRYDCTPS